MDYAAQTARAAATLRALVVEAGALRAVALLDRGDSREAVVVDYTAEGELEVAVGDDVRALDLEALGVEGFPLPEMRALHGLEIDVEAGRVAAPIGALTAVVEALRAATAAFGGRSVVTVAFAAGDPDAPMFLAARGDEPLVVSVGEAVFELEGS